MTEHTDADRPGVRPPTHSDAEASATDEQIALLRQALDTVDAPPPHVVALAKEAFVWRDVDAELAELVYDSATAAAPATVRATGVARQMTFRAPGLEIEIEMVSDDTSTVVGQLVPAQEAAIELRHGGRRDHTTTDALGRFRFENVAPGTVKLLVTAASGATVQTEGLVI